MRSTACLLLLPLVAALESETAAMRGETATSLAAEPPKLTPCQTCCSPGGACSSKEKGELKCCGDVSGASYCCPFHAKCYACALSYRCYDSARPGSSICAHEGGDVRGHRVGYDERAEFVSTIVGLIFLVLVASSLYSCLKLQRQRVPLAHQQGVAMQPVPPMGVVPSGRPMHAASGVPVACAYPAGAQMGGGYPQAYPMHSGYSGGSVAMGAGMGFLGGMMVGEALSDAGHHGGYGGDYGGGGGGDFGGGDGGFAADM